MLNVLVLFAGAATLKVGAETLSVANPASCVTIIVFGATFGAVTVTVAVLIAIVGFSCAEIVTTVLPVPVVLSKLNQFSLELASHVVFEVTLNIFVLFAGAAIVKAVADKSTTGVAAFCVTVIILLGIPGAETVTVAVLVAVTLTFSCADNVIVEFPVPPEVTTFNQGWLLVIVQAVFDESVNANS